jgi:hypothetical protein
MSKKVFHALGVIAIAAVFLYSQALVPPNTVTVTPVSPWYPMTPISATAGSAATAVLTIPAPAPTGWYNYVCYLALHGSNDNTATVVTNAVTTSTNFNSFADKLSVASAASNDTGTFPLLNSVYPGCAKSTSANTATTFTSPNSTHEQYSWTAVYFQAP